MKEYLLGNAAIAKGIKDAGSGLVSGYPGTPSSEIIETLVGLGGIKHIEWSVNEKVALEVAIGASWAGTRSTATMKHVGLNVAADPFMTLAYLGVGGGLVLISADDPFCHSSQNEQDTRRYAQFAQVPLLDPADPQEAKDMVMYGFDLSEKFNVPVILRPTTRVSHARSDVNVDPTSSTSEGQASFGRNPARRVSLPVHVRPLHRELLEKQAAMEEVLASTPWNRLDLKGDHGVIASGLSALYAEEAILSLGLDLSFLKIGTFPAPSKMIAAMLRHVKKILVVEEMEPVLQEQVEMIARKVNPGVEVLGKGDYISRVGELDLLPVKEAIARMEGISPETRPTLDAEKILPPRPPSLCPGCSHRATYYAMHKAFGKNAVYPSDIGCYTMAVNMGTVDTCLCMGASITIASGIRLGGVEEPICCSLGDSTFIHSGLTGLLNAAYNNARITVTVLDNSTTAMTGHQPHPGTGLTATGEASVPVSLEDIAKALGAGFVEVVNPYDIKATIDVFKKAKEYQGLSVVISRQLCVIKALKAGVRRKPLSVNENCTGCKLCVEFGCPAIEFEGDKAKINNLCIGCGVCASICKNNALDVVK